MKLTGNSIVILKSSIVILSAAKDLMWQISYLYGYFKGNPIRGNRFNII